MERIILRTLVGSRAFGTHRPDSDYDFYNVYAAPVEGLLDGSVSPKSSHPPADENNHSHQYHEAERVINQLLKGNINDYMGVLGKEQTWTEDGAALRGLLLANAGKNIVHSTRGIMDNMHRKYIEFDHPEPKRVNLVCRVAKWTTGLLTKGYPDWNAPTTTDPNDIPMYMDRLNLAYAQSHLPERPDEKPYREWLLKLRLREVREKFKYWAY